MMAEINVYRAAIENALDAFFLTRTDGTILEVNPAACSMFGYTEAEFRNVGRNGIIDLDSPGLAGFIEERKNKGKIVCELIGIRKNGERFPIDVSSVLIDQSNDHQLTLTIIKDISIRKKQETELRNSEHNMRMILDNTEEMFIIVDRDLNVINFNKATDRKSKQLLGSPFQKGKSILDSASPDRIEFVKQIYTDVFEGKSRSSILELPVVNGEPVTVEIHYSPIYSEEQVVAAMINIRDITEQAKARREKDNLRRQLEKAEEIAAVGSWLWDYGTQKLSWSDAFFRICGYEPGSLIPDPQNAIQMIYPDERDKVLELINHAVESGTDFSFETKIIRSDGSIRNVLSQGRMFLTEAGAPEKLIGVFHDITEQKNLAKELFETEQLFRAMVENSADIVIRVNNDREITYISPAVKRLMGYEPNELLGKRLRELVFEEDLARLLYEFEEIIANPGIPFYREYRVKRKDGEHMWMEGTVTNLLLMQGVNSVVINQRDITEKKQKEKELMLANERFYFAAKATNDAIWDWDLVTDTVTRIADGLKTNFGYDISEAAKDPKFWIKRVHPDELKPMEVRRASILQQRNAHYWEDEYRFMKADGHYAYVFDKGYIIRDEDGKAIRMIGATQNISHRKETEALLLELNNRLKKRAEELVNSNVELERFAYVASHDLQEPLRMVTSFLQLFKKKYEGQLDATADQYIHFAVDGAERMKKLIMDLLEYSRVGFNKDVMEPIDLSQLVNEVKLVFEKICQETGAVIESGPMPQIRGNRTQLFQLFQNLIGNAIKYHGQQTPLVSIQCEEKEDHFLFCVSDNGIGIDPAFHEKIFVIFQRLHSKSEYSGTGIGLAICKKIVEKHGGAIWVHSEQGKGSRFFFTISKNNPL